MKAKPKSMESIFNDSWVDFINDGSTERYFISGVVVDTTESRYFVCHHDDTIHARFALTKDGEISKTRPSLSNPYFIPIEYTLKMRFVIPQPPIPAVEDLFDERVPFWFETKPRSKL